MEFSSEGRSVLEIRLGEARRLRGSLLQADSDGIESHEQSLDRDRDREELHASLSPRLAKVTPHE